MSCAHENRRELRERVWWCETCGAANLATSAGPREEEWLQPKVKMLAQATVQAASWEAVVELEDRVAKLERKTFGR